MNATGGPPAERPVFSTGSDVVGARNPDSVLFKVTDLSVAEVREGGQGGNVGSGLIDVRSLVAKEEEVAVQPTGTLVSEVQSRATAAESDVVEAPPSRWIWWVMGVLLVAVIGMAIKVTGVI